ncbi:MAG: NUDIX hydrolase [Thermodesulfobacteriota bacterium]
MKHLGCSILFVNPRRQVLLFLRDDNPDIPFPNMWDVPGGHVEPGEPPEECIVREMAEEMGMALQAFRLFSVREFEDRTEYTFWKAADLAVDRIRLTEGQCLRWFTEDEVKATKLAYGFNDIVTDFFRKAPFLQPNPNPA